LSAKEGFHKNMTAVTYKSIEARTAPINTEGPVAWLRLNLFGDWKTALGTVLIGALLLSVMPQFVDWALVSRKIPHYFAGALPL
jgi:general L-amino acid transport system permease protein